MSPLVVPSLLRAMTALEEKVEADLVGIDAILGCPILFPKLGKVLLLKYKNASLTYYYVIYRHV